MRAGFVIVGVAALLATSSAVNATMFGSANLAFIVAKDGELPKPSTAGSGSPAPSRPFPPRRSPLEFVLFFPLSAVGQMASLALLIVDGAVRRRSHPRVRRQTGAALGMLVAAVVLNASLFGLLLWHTIDEGSVATGVDPAGRVLVQLRVRKDLPNGDGAARWKAEAAPSVAAPGDPPSDPDARRG